MANASLGEPLRGSNAVVLYSAQSAYGTPVTPATGCGLATVNHTKHSSNQRYRGPGSANIVARKGGSTYTEWSIRMAAVVTGAKTLLLKSVRSGGALPLITLGFGYQDDQGSPNRDADQISDCKIGSIELGLDASGGHGPLTANLSGVGGLITDLTSLAPAAISTNPWETYEGVFTLGGVAYESRSFNVSVNHNISRDHVIPGEAPASFIRGHKYLSEHGEAITGQISRYAKPSKIAPTVNVQANVVAENTLLMVLTSLNDAATLTITMTSCDFDTETQEEDENGIFYRTDFEAKTWSIA